MTHIGYVDELFENSGSLSGVLLFEYTIGDPKSDLVVSAAEQKQAAQNVHALTRLHSWMMVAMLSLCSPDCFRDRTRHSIGRIF
jgi:hypothetical protein